MKLIYMAAALVFGGYSLSASAEFSPHEVMTAQKSKQEIYVMDAIVRGGDANTQGGVFSNVRWAKKNGYERLVIDIEGKGENWEGRNPPYFQVGLNPGEKKISIDIRGVGARKVTQQDISKALSKSGLLQSAYLAPRIEGELVSMELATRKAVDVEAFYLLSPPRIILDIRAKR